jgi:Family of unknown function (DUF6516)
MPNDNGLKALQDLDGEIFILDDKHWVKFKCQSVEKNEHIPHGIKYSLTLHDKNKVRILGYDNAHSVKPRRKKFGAHRVVWDHKHEKEKVKFYEFNSADQLLIDFWKDVNAILENS